MHRRGSRVETCQPASGDRSKTQAQVDRSCEPIIVVKMESMSKQFVAGSVNDATIDAFRCCNGHPFPAGISPDLSLGTLQVRSMAPLVRRTLIFELEV